MANKTPSRPPPPMANAILNFHFDFLTPSLRLNNYFIFTFLTIYFLPFMSFPSPKKKELAVPLTESAPVSGKKFN